MKNISLIVLLLIAHVSFSQSCVKGPVTAVVTGVNNNQVTLSWSPVATVGGWDFYSSTVYFINYGVGNVGTKFLPGTSTLTTTVTGLTLGSTYSFQVAVSATCGLLDGSGVTGADLNMPVSQIVTATIVPDVPTLATASSASSTSINCVWNATNGATGYDVEVTNSAGTVVLNPTNVAGTSFNATGLTPNSTYFYRVRARNSGGVSGFTAKSPAILTLPAAPTFPAAAATSITTNSFQLSWNAVSGAGSVTYQLDVSTDSNFNSSFITNNQSVNGTTFTVNGLVGGTTHYCRVRAVNASGASTNSSTSTVLSAPVSPSSFSVNNIAPTSSTVNWSAAPTATQYELTVATDVNFNFPLAGYNPKVIASPTLTENLSGLTASTNYFLKLRAKNGTSSFSGSVFTSFLTPTPPAAPTFPTPSATAITSTSFQITWNAATGASSYQLDVSTDPNFNSFVVNNLAINGTTSQVSNLTGGTTYYYRVRAVNSSAIVSANSVSNQALTAPVTPSGFTVGTVTATSVTLNWVAAPTATQYELFAATDVNFTSPLANYNPKVIADPTTSEIVSSLSSTLM